MDFVHLHMHTEYSLLDGANRLNELVDKIDELGMKSFAVTDHGNMFAAVELYKLAKAKGIKLIVGCEVYVAKRSRLDKESGIDNEPYHLILLAMNKKGYENLIKMVSISYTEGFYYKPRIDIELLKKYNEGLICLSGCIAGEVARKIINNDINGAKEAVKTYKSIFGKDRYYLEMQDNGLREQVLVNQNLVNISKELNVPLVATNDCHYLTKDDYELHEILLCIQTKTTLNDENRMRFKTNEFYVKSPEEMYNSFNYIPEAILNTKKISDMCNFEFEFGHTILPEFKIEENISHLEYFTNLCRNNIKNRYDINDTKLMEIINTRLNYEIEVINKMGYIDYFLIVYDFVNYARSKDIPVGPGRGSGAGSLCAYLVGITDIDPIKFNLIFERFLNPERVTMPDFDIDFCYERRNEVIDYVGRKYGYDHVSQIITFGTMAARAAIRDVARVLDIPYLKADTLAKLIPQELKITIKNALEESKELRDIYDTDDEAKKIIDIAMKLEGMPRHASTHAAGVLITKEPVSKYVPLYVNQDVVVAQYNMTILEELGLLKMDFLALRTLTVIDDTIKMVKKNRNIDVKFNLEDKNVFKILCEGKTIGIFQFESQGITNVTKSLKPDNIEDLIVLLSLYRPGPMDQIPRYIKNKNSGNVSYTHKSLEHILEPTKGCMVYQEQVMQIFRDLAGYSLGRADIVRRAMSKKKVDVMNKEREVFVKGCLKNNIDEVSSNKIFDEMSEFAKYAFNKSHAACYAVVAYRTAYLKTYFKEEFMASTMNSMLGNLNKIPEYILECKSLGIEVLKPDINYSEDKFIVKNNKIIFSLDTIKNVSSMNIIDIVNEREKNGFFKSFTDFIERMSDYGLNKNSLLSLIKAGCFDNLDKDLNRFDLINNYERLLSNSYSNNADKSQMNFFEFLNMEKPEIEIIKSEKIPTKKELLDMEKEVIGIYVSGHPLDEYKNIISKNSSVKSVDLSLEDSFKYDNKKVIMCGIISNSKFHVTKNNAEMMFFELSDLYGTIEGIAFPNVYSKFKSFLTNDNVVKIIGTINIKENEKPKIIVNNIESIMKQEKIFIKIPKGKESLEKYVLEYIEEISDEYYGRVPVCLFYEVNKKMKLLERRYFLDNSDKVIEVLKDRLGNENVRKM